MPSTDDLVVSLQDRSVSAVATKAHRGFGVLFGTDLAVIYVAPGVAWSKAFDLEVLISPAAPAATTIIERIRPQHVELASLAGSPGSRVAMIRLSLESSYATTAPVIPPAAQVESALATSGTLVRGLAHLGLFTLALTTLAVAALDPIAAVEQQQRATMQVNKLGQSPENIAKCIFSPKCYINAVSPP